MFSCHNFDFSSDIYIYIYNYFYVFYKFSFFFTYFFLITMTFYHDYLTMSTLYIYKQFITFFYSDNCLHSYEFLSQHFNFNLLGHKYVFLCHNSQFFHICVLLGFFCSGTL